MPAVGRADPDYQAVSEVIQEVNKTKEELKQVYSKKALDDAFTDILTVCKRLEDDNQDMRSKLDKLEIEVINSNPINRIKNLFRRD